MGTISAKSDEKSVIIKNFSKRQLFMFFSIPSNILFELDGYNEKGFHTSTMKDFIDGSIKRASIYVSLRTSLENFIKNHSEYINSLKNETISIKLLSEDKPSVSLPKGIAISLYMTFKRLQGEKLLKKICWQYKDDGRTVKCGTISITQIRNIENRLMDEDKEFITVCENIYSKCEDLQTEADFTYYNATGTTDEYYYPILQTSYENTESAFDFLSRTVSGFSLKLKSEKGEKTEIIIDDVLSVLEKQIDALSRYIGFKMQIRNMHTLYSLNISDDPDHIKSLKTTFEEMDKTYGYEYLNELAKDMEYPYSNKGLASQIVSHMRKSCEKYFEKLKNHKTPQ